MKVNLKLFKDNFKPPSNWKSIKESRQEEGKTKRWKTYKIKMVLEETKAINLFQIYIYIFAC
jgi:hypothetical protein